MANKIYKFSDEVSMRMIQIFQEAIMMGLDGADLLRQVRLVEGTNGDLILESEYVEQVEANFKKYLEEADAMVSQKNNGNIIIGG